MQSGFYHGLLARGESLASHRDWRCIVRRIQSDFHYGLLALLVGLVPLAGCRSTGNSEPADLIIHNARIYTGNEGNSTAEAIAIRGDRIARVGTSAEVLPLTGPATKVIDAGRATIVPGLHDAHGHFAELGASLQTLDLRGTASYQQVVEAVRQRVAQVRPGEWILGRSWDQNDWADNEWPTHDALTAVSPVNPVYLTRVDGHAGLANRKALDAAGLKRTTPDPTRRPHHPQRGGGADRRAHRWRADVC